MSAARCGKLYIGKCKHVTTIVLFFTYLSSLLGDSILSVNGIDLNDVKHTEAAKILLNQVGNCELECVFVLPDFDENETSNEPPDSCQSRYCYFDSRIMHNSDQEHQTNKANLIEFKQSTVQSDSDEDDNFDNISSITNTFNSPSKLYPGGARPLASLFTTTATAIRSENPIKEDDTETDDNYDKIQLQTLDGCQTIFYKNKSTIIN